tara:strand:+ start:444 stop:590 length:147 start_codon:yes stop_codon:yes gene_type:complete
MWFVVTDTFICIDNRAFERKTTTTTLQYSITQFAQACTLLEDPNMEER